MVQFAVFELCIQSGRVAPFCDLDVAFGPQRDGNDNLAGGREAWIISSLHLFFFFYIELFVFYNLSRCVGPRCCFPDSVEMTFKSIV